MIDPYMKLLDIKVLTDDFLYSCDNINILEWGCGGSTLYFPKLLTDNNIKFIWDSIENNIEWYNKIKNLNKFNNVNLYLERKKWEYINKPLKFNKKYDFILVDGRHRSQCLILGKKLLKQSGIMYLHDSHRPMYKDGINIINNKLNCKRVGKTFLRCNK